MHTEVKEQGTDQTSLYYTPFDLGPPSGPDPPWMDSPSDHDMYHVTRSAFTLSQRTLVVSRPQDKFETYVSQADCEHMMTDSEHDMLPHLTNIDEKHWTNLWQKKKKKKQEKKKKNNRIFLSSRR